ncbi:MAG: CDGSH iron-sulfur domain-containing protein [Mariprofundales bacterium]|nr:CDGSH iron-sulfur domain-containing protein [Mariprofundales bacterium]
MNEATIAAKEPKVMELEPGSYHFCTCGKSANQPFCDGSHQGTGFLPQPFEIKEKQTVALCQCKRTKNAPFCDGSHANL